MSDDEEVTDEAALRAAFTSAETLSLLLLSVVELTARLYPHTLRRILTSAFDLSAVEESVAKVVATMQKAQGATDQLRERFRRLEKDIERLGRRLALYENRRKS